MLDWSQALSSPKLLHVCTVRTPVWVCPETTECCFFFLHRPHLLVLLHVGELPSSDFKRGPTMDSNGWADACPVPHVQARAEFSMQVALSSVTPHVWAQYIFIVQMWASFTLVCLMSSFVSMMHMSDCTLWLAQLVNGIACCYCLVRLN